MHLVSKKNLPKRLLLLAFLLLKITFESNVWSQLHWESMVLESDTWKYLAATSEPPENWYQNSFVDTSWSSGKGGLGYSDGDDATTVTACASLYMRCKVNVQGITNIKGLVLDIDYDDAFILYINGVECARSVNVTGSFPSYITTLSTDHEANMYSGGMPERYLLSPNMLKSGENTFALQILNQGANSSDLSARVFIQARVFSATTLYHPVPAWFTAPVNNNISNLPLIFINTNNQTIIQNSKIMVNLKTLNSGIGVNALTDTLYEYNGYAGVEIRGFTSSGFPKKSYTVETRYVTEANLNAPLLGLPADDDWVFHGPYPDKSLMRNALAYHLGNKTGIWSPRTKFFELYIDGTYNGVYTLVEKIKNNKSRLNLAELTPADTIGDELTGGYILKLDRPETTDVEGLDYWISPYRAPTTLQQKEYFLFVDPEGQKLTKHQFEYIKNHITNFENALYSDGYKNPTTGYYPYINLESFVNYYIITELSRNLDGYRISTFIHKDKDSKGGKITMGPFWDYDICFGNANFFSAGNTAGWVVDGMGNGDGYAMPFWWKKFRLDPYFNSILKQRWNAMKSEFLNTTYVNNFIDSCATVLAEPQVRNFTKWNILNTYVWPNNYVGGSYANEITYLKNWLRDRMIWMNTQIQTIVDITGNESPVDPMLDIVSYPNPFTDRVNLKVYLHEASDYELKIFNAMGQEVISKTGRSMAGMNEFPISFEDNNPGVFVYQFYLDGKIRHTGKLIKR